MGTRGTNQPSASARQTGASHIRPKKGQSHGLGACEENAVPVTCSFASSPSEVPGKISSGRKGRRPGGALRSSFGSTVHPDKTSHLEKKQDDSDCKCY